MESQRETWYRALILAALVVSVAACSAELRRPLIAYDFDNPILNERWLRAHHDPLPPARPAPAPAVAKADSPVGGPSRAESGRGAPPTGAPSPENPIPVLVRKSPAPIAPVSPRGTAAKSLPIATAAEQGPTFVPEKWDDPPPSPEVTVSLPPIPESPKPESKPVPESVPNPVVVEAPDAPEVADAASRLVGIRSSFDQDTFLKHVLFVSNVALDDAPGEGLVSWVWKTYGKAGSTSLAPGHLVFLGWGGRVRVVGVVEEVDEFGTAQFVTVHGDEVKRQKITMAHPRARRDEHSGRILNSPVGKGRLAGETLMGCVAVVPDASGSSGLAKAE